MRRNLLVLGRGFIGNRLAKAFQAEQNEFSILDYQGVETTLDQHPKSRTIINCIGFTGENNVDDCEDQVNKTLQANTFMPFYLAEACVRRKLRLIHISSGCIFHYDYIKDVPLHEADTPNYFDLFYSRSKIYAEQGILPLCRSYPIVILRIRIPLDCIPHPKNILTKLIQFGKVIDTPNSITYLPTLICTIKNLLPKNVSGVFNVVNTGALSYPDILEEYRKFRPEFHYDVVSMKSLGLKRTNCLLSNQKLSHYYHPESVEDIIPSCVREYVRNEEAAR